MDESSVGAQVELLVKGDKVVVAGHEPIPAWVAVDKGKIVAIGQGDYAPQAEQVIDTTGKCVLPGVIDIEQHPGPPIYQLAPRETTGNIATGITTIGIMSHSVYWSDTPKLNPKPDEVPPLRNVIPYLKGLGKYSMNDYFYTPELRGERQVKEIPDLAQEHGVTSYKFYLHAMPGEHMWDMWRNMEITGMFFYDDGTVYLAMKNIANLGAPGILCMHCENWEIARILKEELIAQGRKDVGAWDDHSPAFCEAGHVRTYAYYAKITGCPVYVQHATTPETIEEIRKARAEGVRIYGNSSVHYLTLHKHQWRTNVPLRAAETFETMWEALRTGAINVISSDHCWNGQRAKPELVDAHGMKYPWDGLATDHAGFGSRAEALLPVMLSEGVSKGRVSLKRLVEVCCENPARIFGLYPQKGVIAVGSDADFTVVDLNKTKKLTRDQVFSNYGWSLWEGWEIKGWPVMTILRGNVMMEWPDNEPRPKIVGDPIGQYIPRRLGYQEYPID